MKKTLIKLLLLTAICFSLNTLASDSLSSSYSDFTDSDSLACPFTSSSSSEKEGSLSLSLSPSNKYKKSSGSSSKKSETTIEIDISELFDKKNKNKPNSESSSYSDFENNDFSKDLFFSEHPYKLLIALYEIEKEKGFQAKEMILSGTNFDEVVTTNIKNNNINMIRCLFEAKYTSPDSLNIDFTPIVKKLIKHNNTKLIDFLFETNCCSTSSLNVQEILEVTLKQYWQDRWKLIEYLLNKNFSPTSLKDKKSLLFEALKDLNIEAIEMIKNHIINDLTYDDSDTDECDDAFRSLYNCKSSLIRRFLNKKIKKINFKLLELISKKNEFFAEIINRNAIELNEIITEAQSEYEHINNSQSYDVFPRIPAFINWKKTYLGDYCYKKEEAIELLKNIIELEKYYESKIRRIKKIEEIIPIHFSPNCFSSDSSSY